LIAFLDINPAAEGHTLVIPKKHAERIDEAEPETLAEIAKLLPELAAAVQKAVGADGYNVLCNNGSAAGQVVKHLHVHVIPRKTGDGVVQPWKPLSYPQGKIQKIADKIIANLAV
jgi:histidine triad (HIT) family protein